MGGKLYGLCGVDPQYIRFDSIRFKSLSREETVASMI